MKIYNEYWIGNQFLSVLFNGDISGLTQMEHIQINNWEEDLPPMHTLEVISLEDEFVKCEITRFISECAQLRVWEHE